MSKRKVSWQGVFPAVTTQFNPDFSINLAATQKVMTNLIKDGVSGLVVNGSVGENTSLSMKEKRAIVELAVDVAGGQVPVLSGIAELTTDNACKMVSECRQAGADGVMIMPPLVYTPTPKENREYFRTISASTDLPVMLYNNPLLYKNDITPKILTSLADCENIVAFKDSSGNTRPFSDIPNEAGDRFILFAGLDDVVLESVAVGAEGWISGMSNAFPREGETLFRLAKQKRYEEARELYRWFMPLLHLDFRPDLVQCIKLCEEMVGRGSAITRPPRLPLEGETLVEVRAIVEKALANRPSLPDVGL
ncbi:dihydrodipicolinate synthase family protein [Photorhabdus bodei]|uniref:Dihydrodipicolinate synthase family protein n=1 Tax=Photorhabdus bodei TaxID=2029681 RepID=A0A329WYF4_9GAMM|nr:dihydrodipicolinate synthase family protein [Photorhabdus bodei]NDK97926.1 dihydrodipicolinate synthase family protein [Photorhabdus bodei]NDL02176.1 dihydrodipicolinate synthase family protein [Photorhabdus bodei]NDL06250.1 dihydrodipicolinate synthase family protein [Photorhabdus bodei]RAX08113.1 dihydrodipicolinate synthase family protein [Photorhabdus bodei]